MGGPIYSTVAWRTLRGLALLRDGNRCTLGRLFGGECSERLLVHHLVPIEEGGPPLPPLDGLLTVCASHHPQLHAFRRAIVGHRQTWKVCTHHHPYPHGRHECERRLNRVAA